MRNAVLKMNLIINILGIVNLGNCEIKGKNNVIMKDNDIIK